MLNCILQLSLQGNGKCISKGKKAPYCHPWNLGNYDMAFLCASKKLSFLKSSIVSKTENHVRCSSNISNEFRLHGFRIFIYVDLRGPWVGRQSEGHQLFQGCFLIFGKMVFIRFKDRAYSRL